MGCEENDVLGKNREKEECSADTGNGEEHDSRRKQTSEMKQTSEIDQANRGGVMSKGDNASFNIFSYLNMVYAKHGLYDEDIARFLLYVKRRREKLKSKVLFKIKKVGNKYVTKIYEPDIVDEKYIELLLLDVEMCRCRYVKIKTDVNNLKSPYRSTYCYMRRIKRALDKVKFMNQSVHNVVNKNTDLQIKCYTTYIQISYLLEKKKYDECISKVAEFSKLVKLVKRVMMKTFIDAMELGRLNNQGVNHKEENPIEVDHDTDEVGGDREEKEEKKTQTSNESNNQRKKMKKGKGRAINELTQTNGSNQHNDVRSSPMGYDDITNVDNVKSSLKKEKHFGHAENTLINSKGNLLVEEEKRIDDIFDYFLSITHSIERICIYNAKKNKLSRFDEKLQDDELQLENGIKKSSIREFTDSVKNMSSYRKLEIHTTENTTLIKVEHSTYELKGNNNGSSNYYYDMSSLVKIRNILRDVKSVIPMEEIEKLNENINLKDVMTSCVGEEEHFPLFKFLNSFETNSMIQNYGQILAKYYECLTTIHEELIKSTKGNKKEPHNDGEGIPDEDHKIMEKIWNHIENYLSIEKLYVDTERTLLVLMKFLFSLYTTRNSKNFPFRNVKFLGEIIEEMPLLHIGIRYADILKQNIDELNKLKNNDEIFINILQITKNVKSFCLACHYARAGKNAEAHVLFDLVKTRNYVYIKLNSIQTIHNEDLLRVAILSNKLQDLISMVNGIYYFRHLSIYALQVKTKCIPTNQNLFAVDNSFFQHKMSQMCMNPLRIDMMQLCRDSILLNPEDTRKEEEKSSGIRGLLRSFWK
ncbi:signal recognition particle subunit SRP68 [Plasmodium gonderi]|uniref:Signal recognition particle subunit SRP68 n=1 Tax=Plasmodium gonderi TaxID=77519 RepID=A0A1Y1JH23_PLAGO|nr:signal recognition particle subunit SRP68 [Plasmodium gonderi]GAW81811.1 signal recognition particle subunit SRP68 [Plasmodium gonderi]